MCRRIALVLLCVLLLSGSQDRQTTDTGDGWGNRTGNIIEGGYIAKTEDCCYFFLEDPSIGEGLYRMDQDGVYQVGLDGSNLTRLSDVVPIGLTSIGHNIYYSVPEGSSSFGETGGKVYQIDENGETTQLPVEDLCWNMNATEDYIFYRNQTEGGDLYRMDLNGANQMRLLETNCSDINVIGDLVLFRDIGSGLCTIRYDGSGLKPWTGGN